MSKFLQATFIAGDIVIAGGWLSGWTVAGAVWALVFIALTWFIWDAVDDKQEPKDHE